MRKQMAMAALVIAFATLALAMGGAQAHSFATAKKYLPLIYEALPEPATLYCRCPLSFRNHRYAPDLRHCPGYRPRPDVPLRLLRIQAEHVMSAWEFGHTRPCWRDDSRRACSAEDPEFKEMEGDLHNLFPAIGEINLRRSNYQFSQFNAQADASTCHMGIDSEHRLVEPPAAARGAIARAMLYMAARYQIRLDGTYERILTAWNRLHPATPGECLRHELIRLVQGNPNPFVESSCALLPYRREQDRDRIENFLNSIRQGGLADGQP
ncbi:MAG: endonuclease [Succinivibrionaceae bacterium]|nr:endonuclease [Succinivibrionaceae bacterium]